MIKRILEGVQPSLKKTFQLILAFYFFAHFLLPLFLYKILGFEPLYSGKFNFEVCSNAFDEVAFISLSAFLLTIIAINFLPDTKAVEPGKIKFPYLFFYFNIAFDLFFTIFNGGYKAVASGDIKSRTLIFLQYFSNSKLAFILTDVVAGGGSFIKSFLYVIFLTILGSRAAIFIIYFSLAFVISYAVWKRAYKKYILILIFLTPFSFLTFNTATRIRQSGFLESFGINLDVAAESGAGPAGGPLGMPEVGLNAGAPVKSADGKSFFSGDASTSNRIKIGRLSLWETATIPLCKSFVKENSFDLFRTKYDIFNQVGLAVNVFSPIKVVPRDAWPNQYYQAIFLDYPVETVRDNYFSINMGLQTYLRLVTGNAYGAVFLFVLISLGYYLLASWIFSRYQLAGIVFLVFYYEFLIFFDFSYYLSFLIKGFLTLALFEVFLAIQRKVQNYVQSRHS